MQTKYKAVLTAITAAAVSYVSYQFVQANKEREKYIKNLHDFRSGEFDKLKKLYEADNATKISYDDCIGASDAREKIKGDSQEETPFPFNYIIYGRQSMAYDTSSGPSKVSRDKRCEENPERAFYSSFKSAEKFLGIPMWMLGMPVDTYYKHVLAIYKATDVKPFLITPDHVKCVKKQCSILETSCVAQQQKCFSDLRTGVTVVDFDGDGRWDDVVIREDKDNGDGKTYIIPNVGEVSDISLEPNELGDTLVSQQGPNAPQLKEDSKEAYGETDAPTVPTTEDTAVAPLSGQVDNPEPIEA